MHGFNIMRHNRKWQRIGWEYLMFQDDGASPYFAEPACSIPLLYTGFEEN